MAGTNGTGFPGRPPPDPNVYFGHPIVPVAAVLITLSTLFVGMRFWSRVVILGTVAVEDAFIFLGWVRDSVLSPMAPLWSPVS